MINVQNIATDTDFDDRARNEEERLRRKDDRQIPEEPENAPPVETNYQLPTGDNSTPRKFSAMSNYERRIF